ncbi:GNAT family N-acetyltransferase [Pseudactinotalea sp. Z1748]|uniref:GNAT family N-acetyltransferase n=1 Tax=Pseudactinotalea sp. Z1748 TaxID=3413027 RepID=UPI003C7A1730
MATSSAPRPDVLIRPLVPAEARDRGLVQAVTALTNQVYAEAEAGFWRQGATRTDAGQVTTAIAAGSLVVAQPVDGGRIVAAVHSSTQGQVASFAMLAVAPTARGVGLGRRLVQTVEHLARESGATSMQIEVLTPTDRPHAGKAELGRWYERLGYARSGEVEVTARYPGLAERLATPCRLHLYRKALVSST